MSAFLRSLLTLVVLLLAYWVLIHAFDRMNLPNDRAFLTGTAMLLGMLVGASVIIRLIWRKET